jgi:hypothetical protein
MPPDMVGGTMNLPTWRNTTPCRPSGPDLSAFVLVTPTVGRLA